MDAQPDLEACGALAEALLQSGGQIALVVGHMAEFSSAGSAAVETPGFRAILRDIAADVFRHSLSEATDEEIRAAAAVVTRATDALAQELVLVPPDAPMNRPRSPGTRHQRRPV